MQPENAIFRAYDIRGTVPNQLNSDIAFSIGRAIGKFALSKGEQTIVTARDGRLSSSSHQSVLNDGITTSGLDVIDVGMVPTPVLYFAALTMGTGSGVSLRASEIEDTAEGSDRELPNGLLSRSAFAAKSGSDRPAESECRSRKSLPHCRNRNSHRRSCCECEHRQHPRESRPPARRPQSACADFSTARSGQPHQSRCLQSPARSGTGCSPSR